MRRTLLSVALTCMVLIFGITPALALDGSSNGSEASIAQTAQQQKEVKNRLEAEKAHMAAAKQRLAETKQKVCELHQKNVNRLMNNMGKVGQRHLDRLNALSDKIQAFVSEKTLTVSNYSVLVADVNAKKAAAQAAVDKVKADQASFKCDGTDAKALGTTFKDDVKKQNQALKDYKASIKVLLKAVRSVAEAKKQTSGGSQ